VKTIIVFRQFRVTMTINCRVWTSYMNISFLVDYAICFSVSLSILWVFKLRCCRRRGPGAPNRRWQYGWSFLLSCVVSHYPTHSYARLGTAGTIAAPFASTWRQDHTMLAGHALFRCSVFNTALRRHRLRDEGRTSHNKRGRLPVGTEHSDTPPVLRSPPEIKWNLFSDFPT
jgi:hypothetical protein